MWQIVPELNAGNWEGTVALGDKLRWPDRQCARQCGMQAPAVDIAVNVRSELALCTSRKNQLAEHFCTHIVSLC